MTRGSVAKKVREAKELHPERYCPARNCLWRTDGGYCPHHAAMAQAFQPRSEPTVPLVDTKEEYTA